MASTAPIIPEMVASETPVRYFTLPPDDYDPITAWFEKQGLEYAHFFASFSTTEGRKDQKRARVEQSDEGVLLPVQAQGLMEAMGDYATEVYATRVTAGPIDLNDGRKASEFTTVTPRMITTMVGNHFIARVNMQSAQRKLANLMWAGKDQREFREKYAHLEWLLKKNKGQRKQKQKNEKKELDVTAVGLCDMMLEDEDAE